MQDRASSWRHPGRFLPMDSQQESSDGPGQTGNGGLHRRACLSLEDEYFAHGVRCAPELDSRGWWPLDAEPRHHAQHHDHQARDGNHSKQGHVHRPKNKRLLQVHSCRSHWSHHVRRFTADSTAPPVFSILHHVTGRFRDLDRRAECSGSVAKEARSPPLEPTIPL